MSEQLADLFVTLRSVTAPLSRGFRDATVEGESFAAKTGSWKAALSKLGQGTVLVGAAVAAVSVKMAADWQTSMVRLSTSAGETGGLVNQRLTGNLKAVSDGLLQMSRDTSTATKELADGMYMVESAGFHGAAGLTVMKAAAQGAKAEGAPLQEMANALTSALKSYNLGAASSVSMTNQMVAAVGAGKMRMADFASSISTVLPIAASAKLSFGQVGGAMATLTNHGTSAEHATQELAFAIRNLEAPNNVAIKTMKALGLNSNDVSMQLGHRGLTGTLAMLEATVKKHEGADGLVHIWAKGKEQALTFDGAMKKMMGGAVGLNVALQLGGDNAKGFAKNVATVSAAARGAGKDVNGWKEITGTFNFQMGQLKQTVITYGIQLGSVLLPYVSSAVKWFTQHTGVTKVLAGVIGGVLLVAVGAYAVSMATAAAATIAAAWPILAIVAAIAGIAAGLVYCYQHFTWFRVAVDATWAAIKVGAVALWHALQAAWDGIKAGFSATVDFLSSAWGDVQGAWADAVGAFDAVVDWFKALPGRVMAAVEALPGLIWAAIKQGAYWFGYGLGLIVKEAIALPGQILRGLAALPGLVGSLFTSLWHTGETIFVRMAAAVINETISLHNGLVSWVSKAVSEAVAFFAALPGKALAEVRKLPAQIKAAVADAGTWLVKAGKAVIAGLVGGIKGAFGSALSAVKDLGGNLVKGFSAAIGHASPAKKFIPAGMAIVDGVVEGIRGRTPAAKQAMRDFATAVAAASHWIPAAITQAIEAGKASAVKEVQTLGAQMVRAHDTFGLALVKSAGSVLIKLGTTYTAIGTKLKAAQDGLKQMIADSAKLAADTTNAIVKTGDITQIDVSGGDLTPEQKAAAKKAAKDRDAAQSAVDSADKKAAAAQLAAQRAQERATLTKSKSAQLTATFAAQDAAKAADAAQAARAALDKATASADAASSVGGTSGAQAMITNLRTQIEQAKQFGEALTQLKQEGLDATSLSQIASAGPEAGLKTAQALLEGGQTAVTQVAALQKQLAATATTSGKQVADAMYGSGISAAQGLVKGLQSQESAILTQITKMTNALVAAVKKNLKIHSPSAVFSDEVGAMIPAGIAQGITNSMPVVDAALGGVPSSFGGAVLAGPGALILTTPIIVQIDGKTVWRSNQTQTVRYSGRNANNGQALPAGR